MGSRHIAFLAALALLALTGGAGRAEMVNFNYAWGYGPVNVSSSGVGSVSHSISGNVLTLTHATGTVAVTLPGAGSGSVELGGAGGSSVPTASFTATSDGSTPPGDQFFSAVINQVLSVNDQSNGQAGSLGLQTTIIGVVTPASTILLATSAGPGFLAGLTLGDHRFGLSGSGFGQITPGAPPLSFSLDVKVQSATSQPTPEPSSLLLGLGAASLCGAAAWRRRRLSRP